MTNANKKLPLAHALLLAVEARQAMHAPEALPLIAEKLNAYLDTYGDFVILKEMCEAAHVPVSIACLAEFARPDYPTVNTEQGSIWCTAEVRVNDGYTVGTMEDGRFSVWRKADVGDGYTAVAIVLEDGRFAAKPWHEACGREFELAPRSYVPKRPVYSL